MLLPEMRLMGILSLSGRAIVGALIDVSDPFLYCCSFPETDRYQSLFSISCSTANSSAVKRGAVDLSLPAQKSEQQLAEKVGHERGNFLTKCFLQKGRTKQASPGVQIIHAPLIQALKAHVR